MLDAVGTDREVREIWDTWVEDFIDRITGRIVEDRREGLIRGSADARAVATVLMGAALATAERDARAIVAGHTPDEALTSALIDIWHHTIYEAD